jgi:hypothetical protein
VTSRLHGVSPAPDWIDERIDLPGLSLAAVALPRQKPLGGAPAPGLVSLVMDRSEGNPYFAEQIIRYLQEESLIEMSQAGWALLKGVHYPVLPGDIRALLVARLDQLAREVKEIVQTASVLGREFEIQMLAQMLHEEENVHECIAEAEKAAIWAPLNEIRYIFSHGLLRDAAYAMQMEARRRGLHILAVEPGTFMLITLPVTMMSWRIMPSMLDCTGKLSIITPWRAKRLRIFIKTAMQSCYAGGDFYSLR